METEQEGRRASCTSGKASLRIGPRVRVMLVRDRGPIYVRPLSSSGEVVALLREEMLSSDRERFLALLLNGKNKLLGIEEVSKGSLATLFDAIRNCSDERLKETVWLPYDGGRDFTIQEICEYPRWNADYHLGQISYIQILYGDKEMH